MERLKALWRFFACMEGVFLLGFLLVFGLAWFALGCLVWWATH